MGIEERRRTKNESDILIQGVDAVFGEILVTLAKMDWIIKHGRTALKPSQRAGNLLLAHKITTVR